MGKEDTTVVVGLPYWSLLVKTFPVKSVDIGPGLKL